jgi:TRAP-type C4-dicarboxylate transport system permease small subunit
MAANFRELFEQNLTKAAGSLNIVAAVCLMSIAIIILYDVFVRELGIPFGLYDEPFYGTNEIVSNSVVAILFLQLPLSILNKSSLRTTIFYSQTGTRGKGYIDAISYLLGATLFILIAYGSYETMIEGWAIRETEGSGIISIPVYPIRTLLFGVSGVVAGVCLLHAFDALVHPEKAEDQSEPPA